MKILFSPIGTTDPVSESNCREGAMLHICRYRDIDKVYMYMSGEICGYHRLDNRYVYCLNKLSEHLGRTIEYEITERTDLTDNVNNFDFFIDEFRTIVENIRKDHPSDEIYLNVSSGTPAMKSALQSLEAFVNFKVVPIQVRTPDRKSNFHARDKTIYDPELIWECNEDNTVNEDRTSLSDNSRFFNQIKKNNIIELIKNYDYIGAQILCRSMGSDLPSGFISAVNAAADRYRFNYREAVKYKDFNIKYDSEKLVRVCEYLLLLDVKSRKKEVSDYMRGITPLVAELFEDVLSMQCGFEINDHVSDEHGIRKWNVSKLQKNKTAYNCLCNESRKMNRTFTGGDVYSSHMIALMKALGIDRDIYEICYDLRRMERVRNHIAHGMMSTKDIPPEADPDKITDMLFMLLKASGLEMDKKKFFSSYDHMNEVILGKL